MLPEEVLSTIVMVETVELVPVVERRAELPPTPPLGRLAPLVLLSDGSVMVATVLEARASGEPGLGTMTLVVLEVLEVAELGAEVIKDCCACACCRSGGVMGVE